jgi:uncharacterized protein Yka (UPF0111/DUF47 family)
MVEKTAIVESLGEHKLVLPRLVNEALAANERLKYLLSLLQFGRHRADHPERSAADLQAERKRARIGEASLDLVVGGTARAASGAYEIPQLQRILAMVVVDLRCMLAPLVAGTGAGDASGRAFSARFEALCPAGLTAERHTLTAEEIDRLTHGQRDRGDSVHLLVMDMHLALNQLQRRLASEVIDGASVYDLLPDDRPLVAAFMRGLNGSSALRFDHPGLGTTATRTGDRLLIQNDIGTTDAHVLVIQIEGLVLSITYTDVHLQRLVFFERLFDGLDITWSDSRAVQDSSMEDGLYHIATGRLIAIDQNALIAALQRVGSRLVFLIDWNRARKRLKTLVGNKEAMSLLRWAAEAGVGHMGFLRCGAEQMIYAALDFAMPGQVPLGQKLNDVLGRDRSVRLMRYALRKSSEGLRRGESVTLIADEVRTELLRHVQTSAQGLFGLLSDHAGLVVEIGTAVRDVLFSMRRANSADAIAALRTRAKRWETAADDILVQARRMPGTSAQSRFLREFLERMDDVADELEEAAFCLTLCDVARLPREAGDALAALGEQLARSCQEFVKVVETARVLASGAVNEDVEEFLQSTYRIAALEHATDESKRRVMMTLAVVDLPSGQTHVTAECASRLERAGDALLHRALELRDNVMQELLSRGVARVA